MVDKQLYFLDAEKDVKRLTRNHEIIKQAMRGSLVAAPIDLTRPGLKVLDSATSDGLWISDFMKDFPAVESAIGTDIDDSRFPKDLPEGVVLTKQDMTQSLPAEWKEGFDFVHQRLLLVGARGNQQLVVNRLCETVKPGGWIQLIEADQVIGEQDGVAMKQFMMLMKAMVEFLGTPLHFVHELSGYLKDAGFVRIGEMVIPTSYGTLCPEASLREQSIQTMLTAISGLTDFTKMFPSIDGLSREDLETLPSRIEAELRDQGGYYPLRAIWGQKPLP